MIKKLLIYSGYSVCFKTIIRSYGLYWRDMAFDLPRHTIPAKAGMV